MHKNILAITSRSDLGGGPKHLFDLISSNESKYNYFLALPEGSNFKRLSENARSVIKIPHRSLSIIYLFKIFRFCKQHKIKIIHSHGRGAGFYSRLLKLFGLKVVHTFHGIHKEESISGRIKNKIDIFLKPLTDHFICVSKSELAEGVAFNVLNTSKTSVISNGVQIIDKKTCRENNRDKIVVGTMCRLASVKGIDLQIEFIKNFVTKNKNVSFIIAGDGELRTLIEEKIKKYELENTVHLKGVIYKIEEFYKDIDIYLSFSKKEGLPLTVLEAMSFKVPCVLSNVPGNKDLVDDGVTGYLFNREDYSHFESVLSSTIEDKNERTKISENAFENIVKNYSLSKMVSRIESIYKKMEVEP